MTPLQKLIALLEDAARRARDLREGEVPEARLMRAVDLIEQRILPTFPPEPEHRDVETLTGGHVDVTELRGFGSTDPNR